MKIPIGTLCIIIKAHIRHDIIGRECEVIGYDKDQYTLNIPSYPPVVGSLGWKAYRDALLPITGGELLDKESEQTMTTLIQSFSDAGVE